MSSSILQKKAEVFLEEIYPLLKKFPKSEKFCLCQEIKQACYKIIRNSLLANNVRGHRLSYLREVDANLKLLLVLFNLARSQRYINEKKNLQIQIKVKELGRITGGLIKKA